MTPSNDTVQSLLASFPLDELKSPDHRLVFEGIRKRFMEVPDAKAELGNLYKVKGFSDFATAIMWILDRASKSPEPMFASSSDVALLLSCFQKAVGGEPDNSAAVPNEAVFEGEKAFSVRLEQFTEAVQNGTGGRSKLLEDLFEQCESAASGTGSAELHPFKSILAEFLRYIAENELMDDVRVINILSNVSSTISEWSVAPAAGRAPLLEESVSILRDFRNHFE